METCCLTVLRVWKSEPRCPGASPPEATGRRFLASERGCWPCPQPVCGPLPSPRLPSPLCVCVHLLSAHEDTRHRELGSTLMAFSFRLLPDEAPSQMVRTSPLEEEAILSVRNWLLSVVSVLGGRGRRPASGSVASIRRCPSLPLAGHPPGPMGGACPSCFPASL